MTISGTCGNQVIGTLNELQQVLRESRTGVFGEFWIGEKDQPTLAIHTNGDAIVARSHDRIKASINEYNRAECYGGGAVVVSVDQAYQAAAEFFTSRSMLGCIKWSEL